MKKQTNLIVVILVLVLLAAIAYMILLQKHSPVKTQSPPDVASSIPSLPSLPSTCTDQQGATAVITAISSYTGSIGTTLQISGCNFSGFEGDKNVWIENAQGQKGILYGNAGSTSKLLIITLKSPVCQEDTSYSGKLCSAYLTLNPGTYKIYTMPWGNESNKVHFVIK